jgi:circadian clock protein KaiB
MSGRERKTKPRGAPVATVIVLRLYIVGGAPNSVQAIANLEAICQEHLKEGYKLEVVDVLEHPGRAMAEGVLVTPSLAKLFPRPEGIDKGDKREAAKRAAAAG